MRQLTRRLSALEAKAIAAAALAEADLGPFQRALANIGDMAEAGDPVAQELEAWLGNELQTLAPFNWPSAPDAGLELLARIFGEAHP